MKHYSSEQWTDYVRGAVPEHESSTMRQHLEVRCKQCGQAAATWAKVLKLALQEAAYRPPEGAVRLAKSYFVMYGAGRKQALIPRLARLVFDSLREPVLAGVRSTAAPFRHYVYQSGPMLVDIWMTPVPGSSSAEMTGQILDQGSPNQALKDTVVKLWSGSAHLSATRTNAFGEFHLEVSPSVPSDLQLTIGDDQQIAVLIPLQSFRPEEADDNK